MKDKWVGIRQSLFGNVEPKIELVSLTCPGSWGSDGKDSFFIPTSEYSGSPEFSEVVYPGCIESQVAQAAQVSTGVVVKDAISLNKKLISMGHMVPVEFVAFTFMITGISKACSSQISRHRISSIVSSSRRYQSQQPSFVYPGLESITNEVEAKNIYTIIETSYRVAYNTYTKLRESDTKKGDARYLVPVGSATSKMWNINARSLRNFLQLRLDPAAEWEIQRLSKLILNIVMSATPSLFEDIEKKFVGHEKKA